TTENGIRHFYPSLTPDGHSVLYSAFSAQNNYEVYRLDIDDGSLDQLTNLLGVDDAPEISPDGQQLVFMHNSPTKDINQIMVANRDGGDFGNISGITGWDPTWSPDGRDILFASDKNGTV